MGFGIKELVIILIIVLLVFGTKRLKSLGADLGTAIKGFRKSVAEDDDEKPKKRDEEKTKAEDEKQSLLVDKEKDV